MTKEIARAMWHCDKCNEDYSILPTPICGTCNTDLALRVIMEDKAGEEMKIPDQIDPDQIHIFTEIKDNDDKVVGTGHFLLLSNLNLSLNVGSYKADFDKLIERLQQLRKTLDK